MTTAGRGDVYIPFSSCVSTLPYIEWYWPVIFVVILIYDSLYAFFDYSTYMHVEVILAATKDLHVAHTHSTHKHVKVVW